MIAEMKATTVLGIYRKVTNIVMLSLMGVAACATLCVLFVVLYYLFKNGMSSISLKTFTLGPTPMGTPGGGLRNAIVGTLVLVVLSAAIGVPIGVLAGIYQVESKSRFANIVRFMTDVLTSVPSIVIGIFVYTIVVIPIAARHPGQGFSAFAGGVAMSLIMIPIVARTTEGILRMVPSSLSEAAQALGASKCRTMFRVLLPAARSGVTTGVMLAVARVAGETAPLLFTAFGNVAFNVRLDKPIDSLPLSIFYNATSPYEYLHHQAMAAAMILLAIILVLSICTRLAMRSHVYEDN